MGLALTSSGLLLHDDFTSDSAANYTVDGGATPTVSGGVAAVASDSYFHRTAVTTSPCVTGKIRTSNGTFYVQMWNATVYNGYLVSANAGSAALYKRVAGSNTKLGALASHARANNEWRIFRIYVASGTVYAKDSWSGTAFDSGVSAIDAAYTRGAPGVYLQGAGECDYLDARTSHLITCTGLPTGWKFKVTDSTTTATAEESGGTATVDAGQVMFPLSAVQVLDAADSVMEQITSAVLADMGGGDAFKYTPAVGRLGRFMLPAAVRL